MQWFQLKKEALCFRKVVHCVEHFLQQWAKLLSMLLILAPSKKVKQSRYRPGGAQRVPGS